MSKYNIAGYEIEIPESIENYENYWNTMLPYCYGIGEKFSSWYISQWNCRNVYNNIDDILNEVLNPIINKGVEMLNSYGVYDIDYSIFKNEYLENSLNCLYNALDDMLCEIDEITQDQRDAKEYRQLRKAGRGRAVGGGFGLGGAIKGMAQAGAINATTGAIHSVGNIIGNAGSAIAAGVNKSAVYDKYRKVLSEEMEDAAGMTIGAVMRCIQKNAGIRFDYIIDGKSPDTDISKSILSNYRAGRIPDNKQLEQLIRALKNGLDKSEVYEAIWEEYGDTSGDLRKMAHFFGVSLEEHIIEIANNHCKKIYSDYYERHKENINPLLLAVKTEDDLVRTLEEMKMFCKGRDIQEEEVPYIRKCEKIIEEVDIECRTIDGVLYESREIAAAIQEDKTLLYNFLEKRNLYLDKTYEELNEVIFQSTYYKENLRDIFNGQVELADSSKIFINLRKIMGKYFPDGKTVFGEIEFARIEDGLEQKEKMLRNITKMSEIETPIMLINYETNGKSGILFTNLALRIYSKGLIFGESKVYYYDAIKSIISLGADGYRIDLEEKKDTFIIKQGMDDKGQNIFCHFLNESVRTLKMLRASERINLKRISKDSIRCICGELIPMGAKTCPSCHKAYTKEGVFVNTIQCIYCGNRILSGKNFCSKCGKPVSSEKSETALCPKCGNLVKAGKKFCSKCGTQISKKDGD